MDHKVAINLGRCSRSGIFAYFFIGVVLLDLAGCFPGGGYYYKPKIQGSQLSRLGCYGGAGPKKAAKLPLEKGSLIISARRERSRAIVTVEIYLANYAVMNITENAVSAWDITADSKLQVESQRLLQYSPNPESHRLSVQNVPLKNHSAKLLGGKSTNMFKNDMYVYQIELDAAPRRFRVDFPFSIASDHSGLFLVEFEWTYAIWPDTFYC